MNSRAGSVRSLNTPPSSSSLLAGELGLEMVKFASSTRLSPTSSGRIYEMHRLLSFLTQIRQRMRIAAGPILLIGHTTLPPFLAGMLTPLAASIWTSSTPQRTELTTAPPLAPSSHGPATLVRLPPFGHCRNVLYLLALSAAYIMRVERHHGHPSRCAPCAAQTVECH